MDDVTVTLNECPPGLFWFGDTLGFKSEYTTTLENPRSYQCDAYVVASGEYFHGGARNAEERGNLLVVPVDIKAFARHRANHAQTEPCKHYVVERDSRGHRTCVSCGAALAHPPAQDVAALVEAAQAVVDNTYVGKHGQTVSERSKYGNYEAKYYHRLRTALANFGDKP